MLQVLDSEPAGKSHCLRLGLEPIIARLTPITLLVPVDERRYRFTDLALGAQPKKSFKLLIAGSPVRSERLGLSEHFLELPPN